MVCNLFSLTSAIANDFVLGNKGKSITLNKGDIKKECHLQFKAENGYLCGVDLTPVQSSHDCANVGVENSITKMHQKLGHPGMEAVKRTAKDLGIDLQGEVDVCEDCALAESRRKNLNNYAINKSDVPGERIFTDTSWINTPSIRGSRYWILTVDECTDMKWSHFVKNKSDLKDVVIHLIEELKDKNISVKFVRCDNAGENRSLENECIEKCMKLTFKYTPRDTPQHNGVVERAYQTLYNRVRAMLNGGGFDGKTRNIMWAECASTATLLENIIVKRNQTKSPYEIMFGEKSKIINHLKIFGEMGVVKVNYDGMRAKLENKGSTMIFTGYSLKHGSGVFRMMNPQTYKIVITRDVVWLNKMYGVYHNVPEVERIFIPIMPTMEIEEVVENRQDNMTHDPNEVRNLRHDAYEECSGRTRQQTREMNNEIANMVRPLDMALFAEQEQDYTPYHFDQAWNNANLSSRRKWRLEIKDELKGMIRKNVWTLVEKETIDKNQRILSMKWVFTEKNDGRFRARLVVMGFKQIPGIDFMEVHAPVMSEVAFRLLLILQLKDNLDMKIVDVEKAFLEPDLQEEIYVRVPKGLEKVMKIDGNIVCRLNKALYGLVQAAREFYRRLKTYLQEREFEISKTEPCLACKKQAGQMVIVGIYVDDLLFIGQKDLLTQEINALKKEFDVRVKDIVDEYVGCQMIRKEDRIILHQTRIIDRMLIDFAEEIEKLTSITHRCVRIHTLSEQRKWTLY